MAAKTSYVLVKVSWFFSRTDDTLVNISDSVEITVNLFENSLQGYFQTFQGKCPNQFVLTRNL